jgi:sulfatase modifying factor 1
MSTGVTKYVDEMEASYAADFDREREPAQKTSRRPEYRRRGTAPSRVSGMHCRRNKRWTWGSGRGARVLNLRAFATCVALTLASMTGAASGQLRTQQPILNINNPAQPSGPNAGLGSVGYAYSMSSTEVTVAEYAQFLNAMAGSTDPFSLYNANMSTIGLTKSGATYSVAPGTNNRPITFVNWFSAARYVNWLNTGTSTETGAYNLNGSNTYVSRSLSTTNPTFVIPNQNEWYKAAFFNPTLGGGAGGYSLWQVQAGTQPTAALPPGTAPAANYMNVASSQTTNVGAYSSTVSAYGMYDMLGNVTEWTDSAFTGNTQARVFSAAFTLTSSQAANWNSDGITALRDLTLVNSTIGFRVAQVAPVPEPGTIALAATGLVGLGGMSWAKRRKSRVAASRSSDSLAG